MNATISYSYLGIFGDCVKMFYKPFYTKTWKKSRTCEILLVKTDCTNSACIDNKSNKLTDEMQLQTDLGWFLSQKSHDVSSHPTSPQLLSVWGTSAPRHHGDRVAVPHGVCVCMCVRLRLCACEREISQSQAGHRQ